MSFELMKAFTKKDMDKLTSALGNLMSLNIGGNAKTGERFIRAVFANGTTLIKAITATGVEKDVRYKIPPYTSKTQRNNIIRNLSRDEGLTQDMIASIMNISQSTVSNVLKKK